MGFIVVQNQLKNEKFKVTSGKCTIDSNGCLNSPNHPNNYKNGQSCKIEMAGSGKLQVKAFSTEQGYDKLNIGGTVYQGTRGPNGVNVKQGDVLSWRSDGSVTRSGFKICLDQ